jgi:hypothetical protein
MTSSALVAYHGPGTNGPFPDERVHGNIGKPSGRLPSINPETDTSIRQS